MKRQILFGVTALLALCLLTVPAFGEGKIPDKKERCPVCGMFVAKYPQWLATLNLENGKTLYFDGVKDMMAYFFSPADFGAAAKEEINHIEVKDYYSQKWIAGKTAWFVVGSDVLGPMGHELIPFSSEAAAKNFLKDHQGREILKFSDIDSGRIQRMRQGHKMMKMK